MNAQRLKNFKADLKAVLQFGPLTECRPRLEEMFARYGMSDKLEFFMLVPLKRLARFIDSDEDETHPEWYGRAKKHLQEAKFDRCCLKLRDKNPQPGRVPYVNFGVVYPEDVCQIYLRDEKGQITDKTQEWDSIDEMLEAGWDID